MLLLLIALVLPALVLAAVSLPDLDDAIPRSVWAADGAIVPSLSSVNDTSLTPDGENTHPRTSQPVITIHGSNMCQFWLNIH